MVISDLNMSGPGVIMIQQMVRLLIFFKLNFSIIYNNNLFLKR
jgi:hypothetical protein